MVGLAERQRPECRCFNEKIKKEKRANKSARQERRQKLVIARDSDGLVSTHRAQHIPAEHTHTFVHNVYRGRR